MKQFYGSPEFQAAAKSAEPFFHMANDFVFGRPLTLENAVSTLRSSLWLARSVLFHRLTYALPALVGRFDLT